MTDVENIEKVISDNEIKLTEQEIDTITKNIIYNTEWNNNIIHSPNEISKEKINISENVYQDLEMFISYNHDLNDTIYNSYAPVWRVYTSGGATVTGATLSLTATPNVFVWASTGSGDRNIRAQF